jgi:hypothetical protein
LSTACLGGLWTTGEVDFVVLLEPPHAESRVTTATAPMRTSRRTAVPGSRRIRRSRPGVNIPADGSPVEGRTRWSGRSPPRALARAYQPDPLDPVLDVAALTTDQVPPKLFTPCPVALSLDVSPR